MENNFQEQSETISEEVAVLKPSIPECDLVLKDIPFSREAEETIFLKEQSRQYFYISRVSSGYVSDWLKETVRKPKTVEERIFTRPSASLQTQNHELAFDFIKAKNFSGAKKILENQLVQTFIIENVIFNELKIRGFSVDVGSIQTKSIKKTKNDYEKINLEIDFIANFGPTTFYFQVTSSLSEEQVVKRENRPFGKIKDSYPKFILTLDNVPTYRQPDGTIVMNILDFLLNKNLTQDIMNNDYL